MRPIPNATNAFRLAHAKEQRYLPNRFLVFLLCLLGLTANVAAGPGDLDPSFGNQGRVVSSPDGTNGTWGAAMALQADGKIVMAGIPDPDDPGFVVARYNSDGSLDTTFGDRGWNLAPFPAQDFVHPRAIDIQADGKIVVGGVMGGVVDGIPNWQFAIARFNTDGSLDTGFDNDGTLTIDFTGPVPRFESFRSLKVLSSGKVLVAGDVGADTTSWFVFARLNNDGSLDETFGTNGKYIEMTSISARDEIRDVAIFPDGKFAIAGFRVSGFGAFRLVVKYSPNGTGREWSYVNGNPTPQAGGETLSGIAILPDAKLIVVGDRAHKVVAIRLNADGTHDNTFANPVMPGGYAKSVAIQADGKIVANIATSAGSSFSVVRYNADGSLDSEFGINGISIVQGGDANKVIVQPDQKILVGGGEVTSSPTQRFFSMVRYRGGEAVPANTYFDYDGDGRSDVSVFRPANGTWYLSRSTAGFTAVTFGLATDRIVPADYDGDSKTDVSVYRDGVWWIFLSSTATVRVLHFGVAADKPQAGDFDGDGMDDVAVWRPTTGVWYVLRSTDWGYHSVPFGMTGDIPQRGDYDDDGKVDYAVFRPSTGTWFINRSTGGNTIRQFGLNGDYPLAADYDGDGKPDIAVWRPSNGDWYVLRSSNSQVDRVNFGLTNDIPAPADFDGDGRTDVVIYRPSNSHWYMLRSTQGPLTFPFGITGDRPTQAAFGP